MSAPELPLWGARVLWPVDPESLSPIAVGTLWGGGELGGGALDWGQEVPGQIRPLTLVQQ